MADSPESHDLENTALTQTVQLKSEPPVEQTETVDEASTPRIFTNEFTICHLSYHRKKKEKPDTNIVIRSSSAQDFGDQVFKHVQPFLKRGIYCPEPERPCWFENEIPTREELSAFIQFKDIIRKRTYRLEVVDETILQRWQDRTIMLQVYAHSSHINTKALWELVQHELLGVPRKPKADIPKEVLEEQKLQAMIRRLQKAHQTSLVPRTDDAFKQWAQLIMQQTTKTKQDHCFNKLPKTLVENFVVLEEENTQKRKPASRSANSEDEYEEEMSAIRQTVAQIKDLVKALDKRVTMLEEKRRGDRQMTRGEVPIVKKPKYDTDDDEDDESADKDDQEEECSETGGESDDEPLIDGLKFASVKVEGNGGGNPDPFLLHDTFEFEMKEECDEIESDG